MPAETFQQFSENLQDSSNQMLPMCLSLKKDGLTQEYYWSPGGGQIAYRTHDAQLWGKTIRDSRTGDVLTMGTPQRRRRIALIADFRGQSAAEILFERKSLSGNTEQGSETGKGFARNVAESTRSTGEPVTYNGVAVTSKLNVTNPKPGDPCHTLSQDSRNYLVTEREREREREFWR